MERVSFAIGNTRYNLELEDARRLVDQLDTAIKAVGPGLPLGPVVVVIGGCDLRNNARVRFHLDQEMPGILVHGGSSTGVDFDADQWAKLRRQPHLAFPSQWDKYGVAAQPIRDDWMLFVAKALSVALRKELCVLSFPGGQDRVMKAEALGINIKKVE